MAILQAAVLFIFSTQLLVLTRAAGCQPSTCGEGGVSVRFPFGLENQPSFMSCAYDPLFTLRCSNSSGGSHSSSPPPPVVFNLPSSGDFFVRSINYSGQQIQLYDPQNCLPRRFLKLDLSFSPFAPLHYRNYTFLRCPKRAAVKKAANASSFSVIRCLGNSSVSVIATSSASAVTALSAVCETFAADLRVPVSGDDVDWVSSSSDFRLGWSSPDCRSCEAEEGGVCSFAPYADYTIQSIGCNFDNTTAAIPPPSGRSLRRKGTRIFLISALCIVLPAVIAMVCMRCFIHIRKVYNRRPYHGSGRNRRQQNMVMGTPTTATQTQQALNPIARPNPVMRTTRTTNQTQQPLNLMALPNPVAGTTRPTNQTRQAPSSVAIQNPLESETATSSSRPTNIDIRLYYTLRVYENGGRLPRPGQNSCAICQEDYQPEQKLGLMHGCQHSFHVHCLARWLETKSTCPICRNSPICPQDMATTQATNEMAVQRPDATSSRYWDYVWTHIRVNAPLVFEEDNDEWLASPLANNTALNRDQSC